MVASVPDIPGLPQAGELLVGKYRVEGILGVGGMGAVIAASEVALERKVAIKLLLPATMEIPGASARFVREARAVAALQSQHVASVLAMGTLEGGAPYLVMEHLSGEDFGQLIKQRAPLPVVEAIDLLLQAAEAIAEAHARGILHRDLKPKNLFLTRRADGAPLVKVLDFGLSKIALPREARRKRA